MYSAQLDVPSPEMVKAMAQQKKKTLQDAKAKAKATGSCLSTLLRSLAKMRALRWCRACSVDLLFCIARP